MKFTIDTVNKTITLEENISIDEFITALDKYIPDYKDYTLIPKYTPIYPYYPVYPAYPYNPISYPIITCLQNT